MNTTTDTRIVQFRGRDLDLNKLNCFDQDLYRENDGPVDIEAALERYLAELTKDGLGEGIGAQYLTDCLWAMPASDHIDSSALQELLVLLGADDMMDAEEYCIGMEQRDALLGVLLEEGGYEPQSELRRIDTR